MTKNEEFPDHVLDAARKVFADLESRRLTDECSGKEWRWAEKHDVEMIARAIASVPPIVWRPIASAPTDGTEFLARYKRQGGIVMLVNYDRIGGVWVSKGTAVGNVMVNASEWKPV